MRRFALLIVVATLGATSLTGCSSFDPSDLTDWFNTKKPLPGDRRAIFPEGVPGVSQGVPANLVKGAQPEVATAPTGQAEPEKEAEPPAPAKAKAAPRPRQQAARPVQPAAPAQPRAQQPQQQQQPQPQAQQAPGQNNWPAPPASGSFSR